MLIEDSHKEEVNELLLAIQSLTESKPITKHAEVFVSTFVV